MSKEYEPDLKGLPKINGKNVSNKWSNRCLL